MQTVEEKLDSGEYDFLDFGCSNGGSLSQGRTIFGGKKGLGIDIDENKVNKARQEGNEAVIADARHICRPENSVDFVLMIHFLEHLHGRDDASQCIRNSVKLARHFLFIRQPYYDKDGYLFENSLKFCWADWTGHPYHMTSLDFFNILLPLYKAGQIKQFCMFGYGEVAHSSHPAIHPIMSPPDQHDWEQERHGKKRVIEFKQPIFTEIRVLVGISKDKGFYRKARKKFYAKHVLFDSADITSG